MFATMIVAPSEEVRPPPGEPPIFKGKRENETMTTVKPVQPLRPTPYMSRIPTRSPKDKAHLTLGHAKSAVGYKMNKYSGTYMDMSIWEWVDNDWRLLYDIPKGSTVAPWHEEKEEERIKRRNEARIKAEALEVRKVRRAAEVAFHKYMTDHEEGDAEAFVRGFTEGYELSKTGNFE